METKKRKLIPAILILVLGISILIATIFLYTTEKKDKPAKNTTENQLVSKEHSYKNIILKDAKFSYHDEKMYFTVTINNKDNQERKEELVFLVIKGQNQEIITEQAMTIPTMKANSSETINAEFEDVFENITDYEIKPIEGE